MKKLIVVALVSIIGLTVFLSGCSNPFSTVTGDEDYYGYVTMDINPSVDLLLDEDDNVLDAIPMNDDAKTLLHEIQESLISQNVEIASDILLEESIRLGFLDINATIDNPSAVVLSVVSNKNESLQTALRNKVQNNVDEYFHNNGIVGKSVAIENISQGGNSQAARSRAIDFIINASNDYNDESEFSDMTNKEILELLKTELENFDKGIDNSTVGTEHSNRQNMFDSEFQNWIQSRSQIGQTIRDQIKEFQDNNDMEEGSSTYNDWVDSIRNNVRTKFGADIFDDSNE